MKDQIKDAIELGNRSRDHLLEQLERMREFRDRMQFAGAAPRPEQFAVRKITPIEPRRSIAIYAPDRCQQEYGNEIAD